jgi:hypothetical protein
METLSFASYDELLDEFESREWGDGLPIVPASLDRVTKFVDASGRPASEIVGLIPPVWGEATIEKIAVNAVMAGCRPEYMPVIVAAVEAMIDERFNLYGVQATTHPCAPLLLVLGPEARRLNVNGGSGAFGPGWRSNATLGRAIRLILLNIGGARPGPIDRCTQGSPSKYSYCVTENEEESPWEPYRVSRGFAHADSVVAVAGLEPLHSINDHGSTSGEEILITIAGSIATAGANSLYLGGPEGFLFLGPEHARQIADDGFSRSDVQQFLFEKARTPVDKIGAGQLVHLRKQHEGNPHYAELGLGSADMTDLPNLVQPTSLSVLVVGGAGKFSAWASPAARLGNVTMRKLG